MIETAEQFREVLVQYAKEHGLSQNQLAREMGESRATIQDWFKKGLKRESARKRVIAKHPEIFESLGGDKSPVSDYIGVKQKPPSLPVVIKLQLEVEMARFFISALSRILERLLFEASAEERENFRDNLGSEWKEFLELTRGMTSERALNMALQEGRLKQ